MKYVICGNYGVGNLGDDLIAEGIENLLKQKDTRAEFVRMGRGLLFPFGVRSFLKSIFYWRLWLRPLKVLKSCDYFVLGGGGLFTDEERRFTGLFWAFQGIMPLILRKPVVVLGVSIGPMSIFSCFFIKIIFKRAKYVYCRDEHSVDSAKKLGAPHAQLCPDMAAYIDLGEPNSTKEKNIEEKSVLFVLRDYKNFTQNKINLIVQVINRIYADFGLKSTICTFDINSNDDVVLLNKFIALKNDLNIFSIHKPISNIDVLSSLYSKSKLIICMRYHAGILALLYGLPFVSINYMTKSSKFWERFKDVLTVDYNYGLDELGEIINTALHDNSYIDKVKNASTEYSKVAQIFAEKFRI